jgi:peroxiredoxin
MSTTRLSLMLNLLLAIVCVVLLQQNRTLKQGGTHPTGAVKPGSHVAPFSYRTLAGQRATLGFDGSRKRYLLFVISTTCPWCERSIPEIREITRMVRSDGVQPMVVSIHDPDATRSFAAVQHIDFDVVCAASSDEFQRGYGIEGVPTTILVNGDGVVLGAWEGSITPELAHEIERAARRS